jgi:hypothetical protein
VKKAVQSGFQEVTISHGKGIGKKLSESAEPEKPLEDVFTPPEEPDDDNLPAEMDELPPRGPEER